MKGGKLLAVLGLLTLAFATALSVRGQAGITVNNADSVLNKGIATDTGPLAALLNQVTPRVVFEFANSGERYDLPTLPSAFDAQLAEVAPRVVFEFANFGQRYDLPALPGGLDTRLDQVAPRVTFEFANSGENTRLSAPTTALKDQLAQVLPRVTIEFANASRQEALLYPFEMLNDTSRPTFANVVVTPIGEGSVSIRWTSNEFVSTQLRYGSSPGSYPNVVTNPLYEQVHEVILNGLESGETYYFRIIGTDLSNNSRTSGEYQFTLETQQYLYLPFLSR